MDKTSSQNQEYTLTTDNIRFPTFYNKEYEQDIMKPVTIESITSEITSFQSMLNQLETTYLNLITSNVHQVTNLLSQYKRVPLCYIILIRELQRMTSLILAKIKLQFNISDVNDTDSPSKFITKCKSQSIEEVIDSLINNDESMIQLIKQYYPDRTQINDLLMLLYKKELNVINSTHKTGITLISNITKYSKLLLNEMTDQLTLFKSFKEYKVKDKKQQNLNEIILLDLIIKLDNIKIISISYHNGYFVDESDICNQPEDSEQWKQIKKIMVRVVSKDEKAIEIQSKEANAQYPLFGAIAANGFKSTSNFNNFFSASYTMIHYKNNPEEALCDYKRTVIDVNDTSFATMCNLMKVGFMKAMTAPSLPSIKYRQKYYLKRNEKEINIEYLKTILNHVEKNPNTPLALPEEHNKDNTGNSNTDLNELYYEKVSKDKKKDFVSTRLLHCSNITTKHDLNHPLFKMMFKSETNTTKDSLIIYIHGGGFIGGTTFANESYARRWVNELQIPLIGIDYGISPKHPYPKAIDDSWQAYLWIIKHAKEEWQIDPKHIILTGDSAGASICLSLTYLLIIHDIKLPDILILNYPGCETDLESMTNSQLLVYRAPLLHYKFLCYCIESYVSSYDNKNDYILNHLKAPKEILKKLPKTAFLIASGDVLRDGAIRMIEKIAYCDIDCKVFEFKELGHGFFNWNKPAIINNPMSIFVKLVNDCLSQSNKQFEAKK